jgi:apolipoprotein N-acyltransferase
MRVFRDILRVLVTLAAIMYTLIFIDEAFPPYDADMRETNFGIFMVFVLFAWFSLGFYYLWTDERKSGFVLMTWWIALFMTAWLVWSYGNVTVVLGFPVFILGILLLLYARRKRKSQE